MNYQSMFWPWLNTQLQYFKSRILKFSFWKIINSLVNEIFALFCMLLWTSVKILGGICSQNMEHLRVLLLLCSISAVHLCNGVRSFVFKMWSRSYEEKKMDFPFFLMINVYWCTTEFLNIWQYCYKKTERCTGQFL